MITVPQHMGTSREAVFFADGGLPELTRWLAVEQEKREAKAAAYEAKTGRRSYSYDSSGGPGERAKDFNGYASWEDAIGYALNGWQEGAAKIARGFPAPTFGAGARKPRWGFDVAGDLPDVGRYLNGHPDAMRRRRTEKGRTPVVVLYIACGVRANVSSTEYLNFGTAVCEMIDALENAGTRVELNQLTRAHSGSRRQAYEGCTHIVTGWRVKAATDPLDLSTVAFTYMHPSAHRRLQFQMRLLNGFSVGGSTKINWRDFPDAPEGALIVEGVSEAAGECDTREGAREFLRKRINTAAGHELITDEMLAHLAA